MSMALRALRALTSGTEVPTSSGKTMAILCSALA
jgi:Rad3-related DNA helicase